MPYMMMDLLQYVPYALFALALCAMVGGGLLFTFRHFASEAKRSVEQPISPAKD